MVWSWPRTGRRGPWGSKTLSAAAPSAARGGQGLHKALFSLLATGWRSSPRIPVEGVDSKGVTSDVATGTGVRTDDVWSGWRAVVGVPCRGGGRGSRRIQQGGFASGQEAREALERALDRLRRERRVSRSVTLREFVDEYLGQHDGEPETIAKLRWLLAKAVGPFGDLRLGELRSEEIAAWRMTIAAGRRFEATQALRQVLARAVRGG
jgi:hypothetical protein